MKRSDLPTCPACGSTAKQCVRPSGHGCKWHAEREDILARDCMCDEVCKPWLVKRGQLEAAS